jgi:PKD repeat protein
MPIKIHGDAYLTSVKVGTLSITPVSSFTASPTSGTVSFVVNFTDTSTNYPTSWLWNFGDGNTSTAQSPSHTYTSVGNFTVSLTTTNSSGSNTHTVSGMITANPPAFSGTSSFSTYGSATWLTATDGNGQFAQVGYTSTLAQHSTDNGSTWQELTQANLYNGSWQGITYGNGVWVASNAVGNTHPCYSTDGIHWSQSTVGASAQWWTVGYGNGQFVMTGQNFATSPDGVNWTLGTLNGGAGTYQYMGYHHDKFIGFSNTGVRSYSSTGNSNDWTSAGTGFTGVRDMAYGNGIYVASGQWNGSLVSTDGISWTWHPNVKDASGPGAGGYWYGIAYGNGVFVSSYVNGTSGGYAYSTNGVSWTTLYNGSAGAPFGGVRYSNGVFLIYGASSNYVLLT